MSSLGPTEIIIIALVVVLLFGAKKLPDAARGLGRSLRIFKAETKGLRSDDDDQTADAPRQSLSAPQPTTYQTPQPVAQQSPQVVPPPEHDGKRDRA